MADRRGGAPPELKDFQIGCSWIPTTPAKPNSTTQQSICAYCQPNGPGQPNWMESGLYAPLALSTKSNLGKIGKLSANYVQITQCQTVPACYSSPLDLTDISRRPNNWQAANPNVVEGSLSDFDNWQASEAANSCVYGGFSCSPDKFSTEDPEKSGIMSFQELLALANAGGTRRNKAAIENVLSDIGPRTEGGRLENVVRHTDFAAISSSSAFGFRPSIECGHYTTSYGDPGVQGPVDLIGSTFDDNLDLARVLTGVGSVPTRPSFDLNTPACSKSMSFQLEPITPQKTNKGECGQGSLVVRDLYMHIDPIAGESQA